jgi:hypothetical protein
VPGELDDLALEAAKALVDAMVQDGWAAARKRLGFLISNRKKQARESAEAIARALGEEKTAVIDAETQTWARRIRALLDDDPRNPAAVRALLRQPSPAPGGGNIATVSDSKHVSITQKTSNVKISIPVLGPIISLALAHPVIAAVTAVAVAGAGIAGTQLSSGPSSSGPATFQMPAGNIFFDFSKIPPAKTSITAPSSLGYTGPSPVALTNEAIAGFSSNIASFTGTGTPTAAACKSDVNSHAANSIPIQADSVICFLTQSGQAGYIKIVDVIPQYATVTAALLQGR